MVEAGAELFDTPLGFCGMAWTSKGLSVLVLPEKDDLDTFTQLVKNDPQRVAIGQRPVFVLDAQKRIRAHLRGKPDNLRDIPIDLSSTSPFARDVYLTLRKVDPGKVVTYSDLASMAGHAGAARAVGRVMASNPLPLIVPCHRVLAAGRRLGGFSAHGGLLTKAKLLYLEGVVLNSEHAKGMDLVKRLEPALGRIMVQVGPYSPNLGPARGPYDALVESIIYQQLSMKAAATIASRVRALGKNGRYPDPKLLMRTREQSLRACGLSRQKIAYLRDLAERVNDGRLSLRRLCSLGDEEVTRALCEVKGIGVWSAEMFLIFHLGSLDVWPVGDLGLRRALCKVTGLDPSDAEGLMEYGERFRPYRSIATWYFWRFEDITKVSGR